MAFLSMRHDFRAPAFAPESSKEIYAAALEQFAWADERGFDSLVLSEHHGVEDGWLPAPLTMKAVGMRIIDQIDRVLKGKASLDDMASKLTGEKGFIIEVQGYSKGGVQTFFAVVGRLLGDPPQHRNGPWPIGLQLGDQLWHVRPPAVHSVSN